MSYIPFITTAYPDELMYSWISRLIIENGICPALFGKLYLDKPGIFSGEIPYDIRHEFTFLCKSMPEMPGMAGFYYEHTTFRFDMLFTLKKTADRYVRAITMHSDKTNPPLSRNYTEIYVCPDCMEEHKYIHIEHQLGETCYCAKHKKKLMRFSGKELFEPDNEGTVAAELAYSEFVYGIYQTKINGVLEDLKRAFITKLKENGYALHGERYLAFEKDFMGSSYAVLMDKDVRYCFENYLIKKKTFDPRDFIPLLMFLFKDAGELALYVGDNEPLLKDGVCKNCGRAYLSAADEPFSMGLCPDCYARISINDKFKNMVKIAGMGEYKAISDFVSMNSRVRFLHSCGEVTELLPRSFIYGNSRCPCEKRLDERWGSYFKLLLEYKKENGHTNVPKRLEYRKVKLGQWCQMMRKYKDTLPIDRRDRLEEIGFDFDPNGSAWDKTFSIYKRYVEETGSGHIIRSVVYDGFKLGEWYGNLKKSYSMGRIDDERLAKIRELYPEFPKTPIKEKMVKVNKPRVSFEEAVKLLKQYYKEYKTHDIAKTVEYKGYKLGRWANQIRAKRKQGILSDDKIAALDDIGFVWDPIQSKWERDLARYKRYVEATGRTEIPKEAGFEYFAIGYWYSNLKVSRKNNSLTSQQLCDISKVNPDFM